MLATGLQGTTTSIQIVSAAGGIMVLGFVVALIGVIMLLAMRGKGWKYSAIIAGLGLVVGFGGLFGGALVASTMNAPAPPPAPSASVNALLWGSYVLPTGETWNSQTSVLTVNTAYNHSTSQFGVAGGGANSTSTCQWSAGACHPLYYVLLPLNLIRSDSGTGANNATFGFPVNVQSTYTTNSLGSTPSQYGIVGYKAATSSATGQWQAKWYAAGTTSGQFSTVNAPSVSTNIAPNSVPIPTFGSKVVILSLALAGGNSTSAPSLFVYALTQYQSYPTVISVGNGTPATITINFVFVGVF